MGCKKCGGRLLLGSVGIDSVQPDQEPYESGESVDMEAIDVFTSFEVHYCEKCKIIHDLWDDSEIHLIGN